MIGPTIQRNFMSILAVRLRTNVYVLCVGVAKIYSKVWIKVFT